MYKSNGTSIIRLSDKVLFPVDENNIDYQQYLKDVENGAVVEPMQTEAEIKHSARLKLDAEYDAYNVQNMRAYMGAMKRGDSTLASTILSEGLALNTEYFTKKEELK